MRDVTPIARRSYELTAWRVQGPVEPIPLLMYHRLDLPAPKPVVVYYHGVMGRKEGHLDGPLARRLTDAGFAVALPDAPGHGERPAGAALAERLRESLPHEFCAATMGLGVGLLQQKLLLRIGVGTGSLWWLGTVLGFLLASWLYDDFEDRRAQSAGPSCSNPVPGTTISSSGLSTAPQSRVE